MDKPTKETVVSASMPCLRRQAFSTSERRVQSYIEHCITVYMTE